LFVLVQCLTGVLPMGNNVAMFEIIQSETFQCWLSGLKDRQAVARIHARLDRVAGGNLGDVKPARDGVSEMRIDHGPGYRLYFIRRGSPGDRAFSRWRQAHSGFGHRTRHQNCEGLEGLSYG